MQFDPSSPRSVLAYAIHQRPNFAEPPSRLLVAMAALPVRCRRGLRRLGKLKHQRAELGAWIRDSVSAVNLAIDEGEISRQERSQWSRRLHRRLGDLKALDRNVVDLQTALLESV